MSTMTFTVVGMTCGHCVAAVKEEVSKLEGVDRVEIDLGSGAVMVQSGGPIDFAAFAAAVLDAGYRVAE